MSVIRAARAIQIAVSGPIVIFPSPSLPATVSSGESFVFLIVATGCALSGPGSASGLFDPGANKTIWVAMRPPLNVSGFAVVGLRPAMAKPANGPVVGALMLIIVLAPKEAE